MKLEITFEISEKELAEALLPSGGKIKSVEILETTRRTTRTKSSPKTSSSRKKTTS